MAAEDGEGRRRDLGGDRGEEEATAHRPLAMELDTGDALYALLSTRLALLPCLAFLSRRLTRTRHTIADAFLCVLPPAPTPLLRNSGCPGKPEPEMSGTRIFGFRLFPANFGLQFSEPEILKARKTRPEIFG